MSILQYGIAKTIKNHEDIESKGIKVLTLFASSKNEIVKYAGKQNTPFPIIPDEGYKIYEKFGVEVSFLGMMKSMLNPIQNFMAITGFFLI